MGFTEGVARISAFKMQLLLVVILLGAISATAAPLHDQTAVLLREQGTSKLRVLMPRLALGTGGYDNETAEDAVTRAFAAGFRHVHAAFDYYNLRGVGRALQAKGAPPRRSVFVTAMTSPCVHNASRPVRRITDPKQCEDTTLEAARRTLTPTPRSVTLDRAF